MLPQHPEVDLVATLTGLTGQDLPKNVAVELHEWASHAGAFTLYDGFGLVESLDQHAEVGAQPGEAIGPTLRLVRDPRGLEQPSPGRRHRCAVSHPWRWGLDTGAARRPLALSAGGSGGAEEGAQARGDTAEHPD